MFLSDRTPGKRGENTEDAGAHDAVREVEHAGDQRGTAGGNRNRKITRLLIPSNEKINKIKHLINLWFYLSGGGGGKKQAQRIHAKTRL